MRRNDNQGLGWKSNAAYEEATAFIVEGAFERIEEWQALK